MTATAKQSAAVLNREIISRLDVRAVYAATGLNVNGNAPNAKGWLSVHAIGRDDRTPSAAINVRTGRYKDQGGDGESLSIWDFLAKHDNRFSDWRAARDHFAKEVGIDPPAAKKSKAKKSKATPADLTEHIEPVSEFVRDAVLKLFCEAKPPVTIQGIQNCGGAPVRWKCGDVSYRCVRLEGRNPIDAPEPSAVVLLRVEGVLFPAIGSLGERKTHTVGGSVNSWIVSGDVATAHTILDVEGITDLLAVVSAGLPPGWVAVTNTGGAGARGSLPRPWAKGKLVIVAGDADTPGVKGQRKARAAYRKARADEVLYAQLPYPIAADHGQDVRDWLNEGHKLADLPTVPANPVIIVGTDESRVIDEAEAALATREIFQRAGCMVQVVVGAAPPAGLARTSDAPRIAIVRQARIRELLADAADWYATEDNKSETIHPPDWAVKGLEARGSWKIRPLEAIAESPILRADGTVLQTAGYDHATAILYRPLTDFPPIPDAPTRDDAIEAVKSLLDVVQDFPYATPAHRAGWVAALLTTLSRYAFPGPAPLFLFDANVPGCGKSLQTDVISIIATGRPMARMTMPRDDDELRKRITAIALAGIPHVLADNIGGGKMLGSPSLDAALTATSWSDRIMGQTAMASDIPLYATWFASGNNVVTVGDTARRTVHIRLESRAENPEERSDFKHKNLLAWVRKERPRLTVAALTVLSAYCAADRPNQGLPQWGSFEAWSDLVRNAVVWAGLTDPGSTRTALTSHSDREAAALRQLLAGWQEIDPAGAGMAVVEIIRKLADGPDQFDTVRGALWELTPPKDGENLNPRSVGMKLHHLRQRIIGGRYLDRRDGTGGKAVWMVKSADDDASWTNRTSCTTHNPAMDQKQENTQADTGVDTQTQAQGQWAENSSTCPASPVDHADCLHDWVDTPTGDGRTKRECRICKKFYGYMRKT